MPVPHNFLFAPTTFPNPCAELSSSTGNLFSKVHTTLNETRTFAAKHCWHRGRNLASWDPNKEHKTFSAQAWKIPKPSSKTTITESDERPQTSSGKRSRQNYLNRRLRICGPSMPERGRSMKTMACLPLQELQNTPNSANVKQFS